MKPFDSKDPVPLVWDSVSYEDAQAHAEALDRFLTLEIVATERGITDEGQKEGHRLWIGTAPRTFLTPYLELRAMLAALGFTTETRATVIELGAGYGRLGYIIGWYYPQASYLGYEFVEARVDQTRPILSRFPNCRICCADIGLASFRPEEADVYFTYDYGTREEIEKTLQDLRRIAGHRPITVIGRGRATRDAIEREHPWLSQVAPLEHRGNFTIYRSAEQAPF